MHWRSQSGLALRTVPMNPLSEPMAVIIDPRRARYELTHSSVPQLMVSARSSRNNPRFVCTPNHSSGTESVSLALRLLREWRRSVCVCVCVCVFAWGVGVCLRRLLALTLSLSFFLVWERHLKSSDSARTFPQNGTKLQKHDVQMHKYTLSLSLTRARSLRDRRRARERASLPRWQLHWRERARRRMEKDRKKSISDDKSLAGQMASLFKTIRAVI